METDGRISKTAPTKFGLAKLEVDSVFEQTLLNDILPMAAPEFNKITEDGVAFRIYKIGSLEVLLTLCERVFFLSLLNRTEYIYII